MDFSLFYWGNDDGIGCGKYELLLEGVKFVDDNGFCVVWMLECYFYVFGGFYLNLLVIGVVVVVVIKNIGVRVGSCVVLFYYMVCIVEEWVVIDNMINGKVGFVIVSGW